MDISVEYLAGKSIDKVFQYLHSNKVNKWKTEGAELTLREHLRRFSILASMIAGRELRVVDLIGDARPRSYGFILKKLSHPALMPEHGFGWSDGETIYLPVALIDMPTIEKQEELARLLVFFLSYQVREGSLLESSFTETPLNGDSLLRDIYWIVENTRLSILLKKEFPGIFKDWDRLASYLLGRRPEKKHINSAEQRVEDFLKASIFSNSSIDKISQSPEESIRIAEEIKSRWLDEGLSLKRYKGMMPFTPWGRFIPERIKKGATKATLEFQEAQGKADNKASEKKEEEKEKRSRYLTKKEEVNEKENEEGLTLNIYDKVMSWAQFVNVRRPFDDEPEKEKSKKADEMEELTTATLEKTTTTYFDADLEMVKQDKGLPEEVIPDKDGVTFTYPEWDYTTKRYKENFSIVIESVLEGESEAIALDILEEKKAMVKEVKRKFEALTPTSKLLRRQIEGDSIDIDAVVEAVVDLAAGKEPEEGLYTAHRRTEKDISSLFLVDMSMSTDAWVKDRRVIDHEREALVVLCEAMQKLKDRYAVYGFSGQTRKNVRVFRLKGFKEKYGTIVRERLGGLIPYHYTRMGPAIRHATKELKKEPSKVKLLFLLSDGKPNDLDVYEGRYGIEDTRMAIKEAESEGIVPFCLTVDTSAHEYLTRLFGKGNYVVTSSVDKLTKTLPDLYARIARNL